MSEQQQGQQQHGQAVADPWVVREAKQYQPLPVGMYLAAFKGVEDVALASGEQRWRWTWAVSSGQYQGQHATALTAKDISPTTLPGILIAGLLGREPKPGENVKALVEQCVGQTYLVSVAPGPKGGKPGVRSVGKPPQM